MSIKLGNLDVESFKVGSGDCSIYLGTTLLYSGGTPPAPHDYSQDYLTFRALEDGTFKFSGNSINYSLDDGVTWTELASDTDSPTVNSGNTILWKASLTAGTNSNGIGKFSSTGQFEVEGNIMSLKLSDNFSGQTTLSDNNSLKNLFNGCTNLTSAENLILPATTLTESCYAYMFASCSSLTTAPILSATTLVTTCYYYMFASCTSLATAPELPATTLARNCYAYMFYQCRSLTTAPELPATTLANSCYNQMFRRCSSLTTAPELPATTLANSCYNAMFRECSVLNSITCLATDISASYCTQNWVRSVQTSSGTFTKAASMTSWTTGNNGIPNNWTVQDYSS